MCVCFMRACRVLGETRAVLKDVRLVLTVKIQVRGEAEEVRGSIRD